MTMIFVLFLLSFTIMYFVLSSFSLPYKINRHYITFDRLSVSLFLMHGHNYERIWTKFGIWHPYTLRMIKGRLASAARASRLELCAPSRYADANGWQAPSRNSQLAGGRRNGPSAAGARSSRAPYAGGCIASNI